MNPKIFLIVLVLFLGGPALCGQEKSSPKYAQIQGLVAQLKSSQWMDRDLATKTLIAFGPSILSQLISLEKQTHHPEIRWRLRYCIREIPLRAMGNFSLVKWLLKKSEANPTSFEELLSLKKKALPPLIEIILQPTNHKESREMALLALQKLMDRPSFSLLAKALWKAPYPLAYQFCQIMHRLNPGKTQIEILKMLYHPSDHFKKKGLFLLSFYRNMGNQKVEKHLLSLSHHKDNTLRLYAIRCLGRFGHSPVFRRLEKALGDLDPRVRLAALLELTLRPARENKHLFLRLLNHRKILFVQSAIRALGKIQVREAIPRLRPFLQSSHLSLRQSAISALGELRDYDSQPVFLLALKDNHLALRLEALQALGKIASPNTLPLLLEKAKNPQPLLRKTALSALGNYSSPKAIQGLIQALDDGDLSVVQQGVLSLQKASRRYFGSFARASSRQKKKLSADGKDGGEKS